MSAGKANAPTHPGPLAGMRVLELAQIMAGPTCGMMLADMGASVIKVEKLPGGDDSRGYREPRVNGVSAPFLILMGIVLLGTRLIACEESLAVPAYKQMMIDSNAGDIVLSAALTGIPANWLKGSLIAAGHDPDGPKDKVAIDLGRPEDGPKRWRDVWGAGHGVGEVRAIQPLGTIVDDLVVEYVSTLSGTW